MLPFRRAPRSNMVRLNARSPSQLRGDPPGPTSSIQRPANLRRGVSPRTVLPTPAEEAKAAYGCISGSRGTRDLEVSQVNSVTGRRSRKKAPSRR